MTSGDTTIRPVQKEDIPKVLELYAEVFGPDSADLWRRRYEWEFEQNPATRFRPSRLWVAERNGNVVGFLASFPMRVWLRNQEVVTLCPCDLMVSGAVRGAGLGKKLIDAYLAADIPLANALVYSPAAARIYRKLGYRLVAAEPVMLRPYSSRELVRFIRNRQESSDSSQGLVRRGVLAVVGFTSGPVFTLMNRVRRPKASSELSVRVDHVIGPDFDSLWRSLTSHFPAVPVRDRAFVEWRFCNDPIRRHILLTARDRAGNLRGYIAFMTAKRRGVLFGYLMDLFTNPDASDVIDALLAEALRMLEATGVAAVTSLGLHPRIRRRVRRYMYLRPRMMELPAWMRWHGDPTVADTVYDAESWHISYADGDDAFSL